MTAKEDTGSSVVTASAVMTADVSADPLFNWLLQQFSVMRDETKVEYVSVGLVQGESQQQELSRWQVKNHSRAEAGTLTFSIKQQTVHVARFHNSHCRFAIFAWWPNKETTFFPVELDGSVHKNMLTSTEPPTSEGMLKQFMRHNEVGLKLATQSFLMSQEITERIIQRQQERIDKLEEGRFKVLETAESLMTAQAERNADLAKATASEQRRTMMFQQLLDIFPVVKAKIVEALTGQKIATESPAMILFRGVFDGLSVQQFEQILSNFTPEKQLQLLELYKAAMQIQTQQQQQPPTPKAEEETATVVTPPPDAQMVQATVVASPQPASTPQEPSKT